MHATDPSAPDRRQPSASHLLPGLAAAAWLVVGAASSVWLVMLAMSVARGSAGAGLLVVAPIPALLTTVSVVGVRAGLGPLRGRIRAMDRRRATS